MYFNRDAFFEWVSSFRQLWIWLGVLLLILFLFWLPPYSLPARLRQAGAVLEIFGILLVVAGIDKNRASFGKPRLWKSFLNAVKEARYIFTPRHIIVHASGAAFGVSAAATVGTIKINGSEGRLDILERQYRELDQAISNLRDDMLEQKRDLSGRISDEAEIRAISDRSALAKLDDSMTGDFKLELMGVGFLLFGQAMGSFSSGIARCLTYFGVS
jgi:hypothetical protein